MTNSPADRHPPIPWLWIGTIWLALALVSSTQTVIGLRSEGVNRPLTIFFVMNTLSSLLWVFATPLVIWMGRRFPPVPGWNWLVHFGACCGIGFVRALWEYGLQVFLHPWGTATRPRPLLVSAASRFLNGFVAELVIYSAILAISYTIDARRRLALRESQLSQAQLNALRHQLEPHFLFNTLNAIAGLVRDQRNGAAVGMIAGLSDLLRRVLEDSGRLEVPLGEEMEFVERYLEIQRMRFDTRLQTTVAVPRVLYTAQVPSLILQPLVENAIQHGIGKRVEGGIVRIAASREDGMLKLSVYNDGPALPPAWDASRAGIGISNTRARLAGLYDGAWTLEIRNHATGGVEAVVTLPYRVGP